MYCKFEVASLLSFTFNPTIFRCPSPPTAEGTTVTLADSNKLSYHCPVGQMPIGQVNQTCGQNGKWDGLPISCKEIECGQVPGKAIY